MSFEAHKIIQRPIITEESQIQTSKGNQYTFRVNPKANKNSIKAAIEEQFPEVKVVSVNTMNYQGKTRRSQRTRRTGRASSWKKAVITLRPGDTIDLI
jgi:large subunit ribosomal protein L23